MDGKNEQQNVKLDDVTTQSKSSNMKDKLPIQKNMNSRATHDDDDSDQDDENDGIDDNSAQLIELNNQIKNDFMSYCLSFLSNDTETRECIQTVWSKYLQCVGDVAMISAFFDTLPYNVKSSILPKYQDHIQNWLRDLFHINFDAIVYSMNFSDTFARVIRYVLKQIPAVKNLTTKKFIIYTSMDFDLHLKSDLLLSMSPIKFQSIRNDSKHEDIIDISYFEQTLKQDMNDEHSHPLMLVATAGTSLLGHCDYLTKLKQICDENNLWLHAAGDLLASLGLLSTVKQDVNINCDSLSIDTMKIFGMQNLPYITIFIRPIVDATQNRQSDDNYVQGDQLNDSLSTTSTNISSSSSSASTTTYNNSSYPRPSFHHAILQNPSINFLTMWSLSQRCSKTEILHHMKWAFATSNLLLKHLKSMVTIRILNIDVNQQDFNYKRICSGNAPIDPLPQTVIIFRFENIDVPEINGFDDLNNYTDLLNLWLFDKLSQQYPKMNLELLKSINFRIDIPNTNENDDHSRQQPVHAIRFAPLEHLLDVVSDNDIKTFSDSIQRYSEILLATMNARATLSSVIAKYENLVSIPMPSWAGIGAVRYIPKEEHSADQIKPTSYDINTIQAELSRKLQTEDSAFSLGGSTDDDNSVYYIRLGMIRKRDDLEVLLEKVAKAGYQTEKELKYVADMADKIKMGIDKVQKDLQEENQRMLAQEGFLRQVPVISNILSWWSPPPAASTLATKGRSFDLNSGEIESTEDTYVYRMQLKRQPTHAPTHEPDEPNESITKTDKEIDPPTTDTNFAEQK